MTSVAPLIIFFCATMALRLIAYVVLFTSLVLGLSVAAFNHFTSTSVRLKDSYARTYVSHFTDASILYTEEGHNRVVPRAFPDDKLARWTRDAQEIISRHQNPSSCSNARFLVSNFNSGLGSMIHVATYHLALAMAHNRVLLFDPSWGKQYTDPLTCGSVTSLECFFQPPSSCTLGDASDVIYVNEVPPYLKDFNESATFVPPQLAKFASAYVNPAARSETAGFHWYRAQATAYLMRLNAKTVHKLFLLRTNDDLGVSFPVSDESPFPLRSGSVSLHVRHGDKGREMRLVPGSDYFVAAERAFLSQNPFMDPSTLVIREGFISTEDSAVIDEAVALSDPNASSTHAGLNLSRWSWRWLNMSRSNGNGETELQSSLSRGHTALLHLLNLLMALECDVWVGTRSSNWNRLIDELRCVWLPKCPNAYYEVGGDFGRWR